MKNEYVRCSYSLRLQGTKMFNILLPYGGRRLSKVFIVNIWYSYSFTWLRTNISIFVFGPVVKNDYIRYSYLVSCLDMNIFDIRIRWSFLSWIYSNLYLDKNLIFVLHCSRPNKIIKDHTIIYKTNQDHIRPYTTKQDHTNPLKTVQDQTKLNKTI